MMGRRWDKERVARDGAVRKFRHIDGYLLHQRGDLKTIGVEKRGDEGKEVHTTIGCVEGKNGVWQ